MKRLLMAAVLTMLGVSAVQAAGTTTVSATGGVSVSSTGWQSTGEVVLLRAKPGECMTYSITGTSPRGIIHFQKSRDKSNWTSLVSSTTLGGIGTISGTECADDAQTSATLYRVFASSRTSGSWTVTLADASDLVQQRTNTKGLPIWEIYDDSVRSRGAATVDGALTTGSMSVPAGTITVSTATTSSASMCFAGAVASLPTTGYAKGCVAYLTSDNKVYVSTETVSKTQSWQAIGAQ